MGCVVVLGCQWGDEGKGKVVDFLSEKIDVVLRFQGGNNAERSITVGREEKKFRLLPSCVLWPKTVAIIGNGVVVDPQVLLDEIQMLKADGINLEDQLFISDSAHLITELHTFSDQQREIHKLNAKGTKLANTGRGIGPCYEDKCARVGLRFLDFFNMPLCEEKFYQNASLHLSALRNSHLDSESIPLDKIYSNLKTAVLKLLPFVTDTTELVHDLAKVKKNILLEGAQGTFLDVDHGTYPFVTSSNTTIGGALTGSGLSCRMIQKVIGVSKCYSSRVGEGPFPTELKDDIGKTLSMRGAKIEAARSTKRYGWLDICQLKKACQINGIDILVLTRLEALDDFEYINVCTHYLDKNSQKVDRFPNRTDLLAELRPQYKTFTGWRSSTHKINKWHELPKQAKEYISYIAESLNIKISIISTGTARADTILLEEVLI